MPPKLIHRAASLAVADEILDTARFCLRRGPLFGPFRAASRRQWAALGRRSFLVAIVAAAQKIDGFFSDVGMTIKLAQRGKSEPRLDDLEVDNR
jgi:hypothetical protein